MAFNADMSSGRTAAADLKARLTVNRGEIFPRLIAMQKAINARSFAVFRVTGSGLPRKRMLQCECESWAANGAIGSSSEAFVSCYGDLLLSHIDDLLLPLMWNAKDNAVCCMSSEFGAFITRLPPGTLPFAGVAFPVRLGAVGNGYVIFALNGSEDIDSDVMIDMHNRSCKLMMDILSLSERKVAPSEALSDREIACLQLAGDGRISEEIADNLGLSVHTVNAYLGSATIKLDSVNRIQAIAKAIRLGYIN
ncbi:transcriptional regulator VisR [Allorhizobium taibaishanense]|uniref:DNA-binding CsgD family transcriptional regulator n=1 Tax=Allorhizobium taibaishanense TaxID=887144 RepID=A0A1Q9A1L9_9HYPH|nr:DNA-binding CsgD family transcriptional regulator [Allorhizobium taibaishanense]OLP48477.1 helix-turn-helix transcriptional regulator [Allorhizobium taibaishanense]